MRPQFSGFGRSWGCGTGLFLTRLAWEVRKLRKQVTSPL